jgi:hypothetical protein
MQNLIDINSRIKYGGMIRDIFLKDKKQIFKFEKFNNIRILYTLKEKIEYYIKNHLGSIGGSIDAEAYKLEPKTGYKLALKFCPLTKAEMMHVMDMDYKVWKELEILKIIYGLLQINISPNLPIIYFYFICNNMHKNDYNNPNIKKFYNNRKIRKTIKDSLTDENDTKAHILNRMIKKKDYGMNSLCIANELCDMTIKDILNEKYVDKIDDFMFKSFMFQIISGIYSYVKHGNIAHFDLHGNNILISEITPDRYWAYKINNKVYYVYNYGYLLKVWDFGRSYIINKDSNEVIITQLKSQMIRFMDKLFEEDPELKTDMYTTITSENIHLICFCFDLWRITTYILTKLYKNEYLSYKYADTIKLLKSIEKICTRNWIYGLVNRNITNTLDQLVDSILNKYFTSYKKANVKVDKSNCINKKYYES